VPARNRLRLGTALQSYDPKAVSATRTLVLAVVGCLAIAVGFAFTFGGRATELTAAVVLIALLIRGMAGVGRRVRHHH
jgi:hypothetical protein